MDTWSVFAAEIITIALRCQNEFEQNCQMVTGPSCFSLIPISTFLPSDATGQEQLSTFDDLVRAFPSCAIRKSVHFNDVVNS